MNCHMFLQLVPHPETMAYIKAPSTLTNANGDPCYLTPMECSMQVKSLCRLLQYNRPSLSVTSFNVTLP